MPTLADVMSTRVHTIQPQESLRRAAQCMQELDVGALPVCDGERLLGMLTDRDIIVRGIADGLDPDQACVSDIMSPEVEYGRADQSVDDARRLMGARQLRRLPVVDAQDRLVGIVSLGDLATRQSGPVDETLREISEPGSPAR